MATSEFIWPPQCQHRIELKDGVSLLMHDVGPISEECFAVIASGHRFHAYGIANNSMLLCDPAAEVRPDDLVVVMNDGKPEVKLYRPTQPIPEGSDMPVLKSKKAVHAKIIGSFNFYA